MSSLADLPYLTGFFSYSREDDEGSNGSLSTLREAIQDELSAQLGRTHEDFRIWQDKSAISLGTLWEKQITEGINQSAFFIPIITPRVLRSHHCGFEFRAFLQREAELGRDDLVFPILYISVPELRDEKLWRQDPVLAIVGKRQYLDWQGMRHRQARSFEVQEKLEWYCRGITNALHKTWIAPDVVNSTRDEAVKIPQPGMPHRGADTPEHEKLIRTGETPQPVTEERGRQQIAEQRAQHEWAFPSIKSRLGVLVAAALAVLIVGSVAGWFALWPSTPKSTQISRAISTKLADAPKLPSLPDSSRPVPVPASPPVSVPTATPAPDEAAWALIRESNDVAALRRFVAQFPDSARRNEAEARLESLLAAEAAWNSVRDSKDTDQLRHFVKQFPHSERRNEAEARLDSLVAAEASWNLIRDSNDPDQLRQFVLQFPDSAERPAAEQKIAALAAKPPPSPMVVPPPDPHELTRSLQLELQRVGCFKGAVTGQFDDDTKTAWHRFIKLTSISMSDDVSTDAVNAVRGVSKRVCPLECPRGNHAEGETCVANAPPPKVANTPPPKVANTPPPKTAAPKPAAVRDTVRRGPAAAQAPQGSPAAAHSNCFGTMAALSGSAMSRETCGY
jgi:hypothetical protein